MDRNLNADVGRSAGNEHHSGNDLYVVYASDDKFAEILGISLTSLYENNKDMEQIHVYVLDSKIFEEHKKRLESVSTRYERNNIQWIQARNISEELSMEISVDRGSLSHYARLFVSSVLPQNLDRVLYLDCDIIIKQPLDELWKLIDLKRWKEQEVEKRLLKFIKSKNGKIQQADQGALNAVLSHDTYCFEPRFNSVTIYYDFSYKEMMVYRKAPEFYTEEQVKEAVDNPVIIHFTTSFFSRRPWIVGCQHRYVGEWMKYKDMSPWEDEPLWKYKKVAGVKGISGKLAGKLPRKMMITVTGIAQAYGRPIMNRIKR